MSRAWEKLPSGLLKARADAQNLATTQLDRVVASESSSFEPAILSGQASPDACAGSLLETEYL